MLARWKCVCIVALVATTLLSRALVNHFVVWPGRVEVATLPPAPVQLHDPAWRASVIRQAPERVTALTAAFDERSGREDIYVGTAPSGDVYCFMPEMKEGISHFATGLGDAVKSGTCEVSRIAMSDLDGDGTPELLVQTSQVLPLGRPRLYVWSLTSPATFRGVARPDVTSSWSHGLGLWQPRGSDTTSVFSSFCGHGEIVEFQVGHQIEPSGFRYEGVAWRKVGQCEASGEDLRVADANNDGVPDLCVATGFAQGKAAILVYSIGESGVEPTPRHVVDESGRFGNVRFVVSDLNGNGSREIVAWWCTDLSGGECEMIHYSLGPGGVVARKELTRGPAANLWPRDGQFDVTDTDRNGVGEVWFITNTGHLWCYEPKLSRSVGSLQRTGPSPGYVRFPTRFAGTTPGPRSNTSLPRVKELREVAVIEGEVGPLAVGHDANSGAAYLYVATDRLVLRLERDATPAETRPAPGPIATSLPRFPVRRSAR